MYGNKIKKIRAHFGLSRNDLADKIGISAVAVGKIENDHTNPSIDTIKSLAEEFNINLYNFILNEGTLFSKEKIKNTETKEKKINKSLIQHKNEKTSNIPLSKNDKSYNKKEIPSINSKNLERKLIKELEINREEKKNWDKIIKNILKKILRGNLTLEEFVEIVFDIE